ncbi:MAG: RNAase P [archaeon]|nr:RNAase P [archaeon]
MSRRPISLKAAVRIASLRIASLSKLAFESLRNGNNELAKRYICLMKRISQRINVPIPKEFIFCKKCNIPLIIGSNCRVRLNANRVKITCLGCGNIKRLSYNER